MNWLRTHDHGRRPTFTRGLLELHNADRRSPEVAVAIDEALAATVACGASPPTLRIWTNEHAVVVPRRHDVSPAARFCDLLGQRWPICVRSSGGAAVAHSPGTLNMSLILPLRDSFDPSISDSYRLWSDILGFALHRNYGIEVDVTCVKGAFCSGRYDAAVDGRKLAGVAQARRNGSVLIHGTILVHVDCAEYLAVVSTAERALDVVPPLGGYYPERIISLHEIVGCPVRPDELAEAIGAATAGNQRELLEFCDEVSSRELEHARQLVSRYSKSC